MHNLSSPAVLVHLHAMLPWDARTAAQSNWYIRQLFARVCKIHYRFYSVVWVDNLHVCSSGSTSANKPGLLFVCVSLTSCSEMLMACSALPGSKPQNGALHQVNSQHNTWQLHSRVMQLSHVHPIAQSPSILANCAPADKLEQSSDTHASTSIPVKSSMPLILLLEGSCLNHAYSVYFHVHKRRNVFYELGLAILPSTRLGIVCRMRHPNGTLQLLDQAQRHFNISLAATNSSHASEYSDPDPE